MNKDDLSDYLTQIIINENINIEELNKRRIVGKIKEGIKC